MDAGTTITRLRSELEEALGTVEGAMTKSIVSVSREMPASEALAYLLRRGIGGAPVVEHDRVVGIVTTSDLAGRHPYAHESGPFLRPRSGGPAWQVEDLMTECPETASADEPLIDAVIRMANGGVDRLPVLDPVGRPLGIVARDDVIRVLARAAEHGAGDLEARIEARRPSLVPD